MLGSYLISGESWDELADPSPQPEGWSLPFLSGHLIPSPAQEVPLLTGVCPLI